MVNSRFLQWIVSHPAKFFGFGTIGFGLLMVTLIPPFQPPDEGSHFVRSYEVSQLKISQPHNVKGVRYRGNYLPKSIRTTYDDTKLKLPARSIDVPQAHKISYRKILRTFRIPLNKSDTEFVETGTSPQYVPTSYLPQAVLVAILRAFNAPVIAMLYATRLLCLAIWAMCGIVAIRMLQNRKLRLPLASVLLLPMFMSQAAIPGTDALLTGLTVLFAVFIYNLYQRKTAVTSQQYLSLSLLLLFMTLAKPVYVVFGLLILPLYLGKRGLAGWLLRAVPAIIAGLAYVGWTALTKPQGGPVYSTYINSVHADPSAQVHYLIPHVLRFVEPLINTVFLGWGDVVYSSMIGVFGQLDTPLPLLYVILGYLLIVFCATATADDTTETTGLLRSQKIAVVATIVSYCIGIYLSMYIISTPPETKVIIGVQGRYFLPVVLLLPLFASKLIRVSQPRLVGLYFFVPLLIAIASLVSISLRYYLQYPK